jgi:hypothetical protein
VDYSGLGCCAGIEIVTPEIEANRPGLSAIAYRAGTYATFFETMLARISNLYLDVPAGDNSGNMQRIYPLSGLTTRALTDPSIALLDSWATVADVLDQGRIANEGFLRTATERRSVLELARLVGYRLRPGISSSVYLAFTVAAAFDGIIPLRTRAQSIPGAGEKPQFFETYEDLPARDVWNNLAPRLTRPQVITLASSPVTNQPIVIDQGTDATTRDTIYFDGISTSLKTGDALLVVSGNGAGEQWLRFVDSVNVQADQKRTEVRLQEPAPQIHGSGTGAQRAVSALQNALNPFIEDASNIFPDGELVAGSRDSPERSLRMRRRLLRTTRVPRQPMLRSWLPSLSRKSRRSTKSRCGAGFRAWSPGSPMSKERWQCSCNSYKEEKAAK